jgi:hypothetical protein
MICVIGCAADCEMITSESAPQGEDNLSMDTQVTFRSTTVAHSSSTVLPPAHRSSTDNSAAALSNRVPEKSSILNPVVIGTLLQKDQVTLFQSFVLIVIDLHAHAKLHFVQTNKLKRFAKVFGSSIATVVTKNVTHIITNTDPRGIGRRTTKFATAVLLGKWVVSFDWVEACLQHNFLVEEEQFEVKGDPHAQVHKSNPLRSAIFKCSLAILMWLT